MMIRPSCFSFDPESAQTNEFQSAPTNAESVRLQALQEFDEAATKLRAHGVHVVVTQDSPLPPKPDAVFPNNWLSMWPDGTIYLYPMCAANRRLERRQEVIDELKTSFLVAKIVDLSAAEKHNKYLESTGAMVFDHLKKRVYACRSARCDASLLRTHATELGYTPIIFDAFGAHGLPIYHTNVMLSIQTHTAVICAEAIPPAQRAQVLSQLEQNREVIKVTLAQMGQFAGNILEVQTPNGAVVAMSQNAHDAFTPQQRRILTKNGQIVALKVPTIERVGGGSLRCMLAEIFLPAVDSPPSA